VTHVDDAQRSLFDRAAEDAGVARLDVACDGGSRGNPGPAAIGAVVSDATTDPPTILAEISETIGVTTNNVAEYRALLAGLDAAARFGHDELRVRADSLLLVEQLRGRYKVRDAKLVPLHAQAREKLRHWRRVDLQHVRREFNRHADALVNRALDAAP
jgi:ribonuclease HI